MPSKHSRRKNKEKLNNSTSKKLHELSTVNKSDSSRITQVSRSYPLNIKKLRPKIKPCLDIPVCSSSPYENTPKKYEAKKSPESKKVNTRKTKGNSPSTINRYKQLDENPLFKNSIGRPSASRRKNYLKSQEYSRKHTRQNKHTLKRSTESVEKEVVSRRSNDFCSVTTKCDTSRKVIAVYNHSGGDSKRNITYIRELNPTR